MVHILYSHISLINFVSMFVMLNLYDASEVSLKTICKNLCYALEVLFKIICKDLL